MSRPSCLQSTQYGLFIVCTESRMTKEKVLGESRGMDTLNICSCSGVSAQSSLSKTDVFIITHVKEWIHSDTFV